MLHVLISVGHHGVGTTGYRYGYAYTQLYALSGFDEDYLQLTLLRGAYCQLMGLASMADGIFIALRFS